MAGEGARGIWEDEAVDDLEHAERAYQAAMFAGETADAAAALQDLGGSGPEYDLARGKLRHCANIAERRQDTEELACFERAETAFARRGDLRGAGEALFWQGCYRQVLAGDDEIARPLFERALELSQQSGDPLTSSYSLRHLGISRHMAKDLDAAERLLEESTSLRRAIGFEAGVAANLVGLAFIALDRGDRQQAQIRAQEAEQAARECGAHAVAGWARQASEAATR
jgi:tetratricopeptide (TPR) repeat protein